MKNFKRMTIFFVVILTLCVGINIVVKDDFFVPRAEAKEIYAYSVGNVDYYVDLEQSVAPRQGLWGAVLVTNGVFYKGQENVMEYIFYRNRNGEIVSQKNCRNSNVFLKGNSALYSYENLLEHDVGGQAVYKILSSYQEYILSKPQRHQDDLMRGIKERMREVERKIESDIQEKRKSQAEEEAELDEKLKRLRARGN